MCIREACLLKLEVCTFKDILAYKKVAMCLMEHTASALEGKPNHFPKRRPLTQSIEVLVRAASLCETLCKCAREHAAAACRQP